jgi:mannosyltransferase OCH1-like enzyme
MCLLAYSILILSWRIRYLRGRGVKQLIQFFILTVTLNFLGFTAYAHHKPSTKPSRVKKTLIKPFSVYSKKIVNNTTEMLVTPFDQSMAPAKNYVNHKKMVAKNIIWQKIKSNYNAYIINAGKTNTLRIPKIIHQIWLGSPLPEKYLRFQQSWKNIVHPYVNTNLQGKLKA